MEAEYEFIAFPAWLRSNRRHIRTCLSAGRLVQRRLPDGAQTRPVAAR